MSRNWESLRAQTFEIDFYPENIPEFKKGPLYEVLRWAYDLDPLYIESTKTTILYHRGHSHSYIWQLEEFLQRNNIKILGINGYSYRFRRAPFMRKMRK